MKKYIAKNREDIDGYNARLEIRLTIEDKKIFKKATKNNFSDMSDVLRNYILKYNNEYISKNKE